MVWVLQNFDDRRRCWILFLDRTMAKQIFIFNSRIGQNSGNPEYQFGREISHLSGSTLNGSKRLAIYVLRLSEAWPVDESAILGRLHRPV
jgi:hypothetical protein